MDKEGEHGVHSKDPLVMQEVTKGLHLRFGHDKGHGRSNIRALSFRSSRQTMLTLYDVPVPSRKQRTVRKL